jgi:hypothetical protein
MFADTRFAFQSWETTQMRTDWQLYIAIGRLAELVAVVGNDHETLVKFAETKGARATRASTIYTIVVRLVIATDRKKASKYAMILQLAARHGVKQAAESVASFIKAEGGIEACLRKFRNLPSTPRVERRNGTQSILGEMVEQIAHIERVPAPNGFQLEPISEDYFLVVGERHPDGVVHLLLDPITDRQLVRRASRQLRRKVPTKGSIPA